MGAKCVQLEVSGTTDTQTKFYEGIGYKQMKRVRHAGEDIILLQKDLCEVPESEDEEDL